MSRIAPVRRSSIVTVPIAQLETNTRSRSGSTPSVYEPGKNTSGLVKRTVFPRFVRSSMIVSSPVGHATRASPVAESIPMAAGPVQDRTIEIREGTSAPCAVCATAKKAAASATNLWFISGRGLRTKRKECGRAVGVTVRRSLSLPCHPQARPPGGSCTPGGSPPA